ncbi:hypothetical protein SAMN05216350_103102 [Polaromonas sp. YR568]|uniref:DUF3592 domain-containing protein n=1 Tax=Polaromonas sp. YR568 TaxID=1855301 RepID=UPI0008E6A06E|nr:DUF3592 domain-containing protein [Polaromonas sp. YR568]SFU60803.1 hypothetical protein SAMN05216350_103102 [Polaromonas sp. YR568]
MKFLALLLLIFSGVFYLFGSEEKERIETMTSVASSPGFAPATMDGMSKISSKRGDSYRVHFKYVVNGVTYRTSTTSTNETGALQYASQPTVEVAYDTRKPSVATLRRYYDLRDKRETVGRALFVSGILSLGIALPIAFGFAWPLGWLRRKKKVS